jgi:hypothetical protein
MRLDAINNIDNSDYAACFDVLWHADAVLPLNCIKLLGRELGAALGDSFALQHRPCRTSFLERYEKRITLHRRIASGGTS